MQNNIGSPLLGGLLEVEEMIDDNGDQDNTIRTDVDHVDPTDPNVSNNVPVATGTNAISPLQRQQHQQRHTTTTLLFGIAGMLNNCAYVIMLANAKYISEGGVASVYIANIVPGLLVQITAPYWFDAVSYHVRLLLASISMFVAFSMVAYFSHHSNTYSSNVVLSGQLLGVALVSFQCGLGEASLLALAGKWDRSSSSSITATQYDPQVEHEEQEETSTGARSSTQAPTSSNGNWQQTKGKCLSAFAMGTGIAGPIGFLWKIALNEWFGLSVTSSLIIAAIVLSSAYGTICTKLAAWSQVSITGNTYTALATTTAALTESDNYEAISMVSSTNENGNSYDNLPTAERDQIVHEVDGLFRHDRDLTNTTLPALADLSSKQRFRLLFTMCWPYMIPLFVVYAAEYACQAGAWTSIGFPVTSVVSRTHFFEQSNWLYQVGVLISRSTGTFFTINIIGLWTMPALQVINLIIFSVTASTGMEVPLGMLYHKPILLLLSFYTGLLGGAVYVHGYNRIVSDVPEQYTEFAVSSTSVAVSLGVLVADVMGLFLQSCLYQVNGIEGAAVQCPL